MRGRAPQGPLRALQPPCAGGPIWNSLESVCAASQITPWQRTRLSCIIRPSRRLGCSSMASAPRPALRRWPSWSHNSATVRRPSRPRSTVISCRGRRGRAPPCGPATRSKSSLRARADEGLTSHRDRGMNAIERRFGTARPLTLYGEEVSSRLLLGTARYPSPQIMSDAVRAARVSILTVSLRREQARGHTGARFFDLIKTLGVRVMPNTAGCRTPKEAIGTAQMARELFATDWVKLEVIGNDDTLQPDLFGLVEAAD